MAAQSKALAVATAVTLKVPVADGGGAGSGVDLSLYEGTGLIVITTGAQGTSGILKWAFDMSVDNSAFVACNTTSVSSTAGAAGTVLTAASIGANQTLSYPIDIDATSKWIRVTSVLQSGATLVAGVVLIAYKKVSG